mmetsp:Transcript_27276/g.37584  ORF Transcript_27276/g.37584 Transcript_27276/m.37584 type:complete len:106 (-) Transcript_27276:768-1085(-)
MFITVGLENGNKTILKAMESLSFNMVKEIKDIKSEAYFKISKIKPSQTCKSENLTTFNLLLECLHLRCGCDLTAIVLALPKRLILRMCFQSSLTSGLKGLVPIKA